MTTDPSPDPNPHAKLSKARSLARIRDLGIAPKTIFDIGVATGTRGLYDVFPDVRYVLVEPLDEAQTFVQRLVDEHPGSIGIQAAAGRAPGEGTFTVEPGLSGSSFLLKHKNGVPRQVKIVTVDDLVKEHALEGPFLLKLDVQGFELEVLAGAEETLKDTVAVIAEASLWADVKGKGMATLISLMTWFNDHGFVLYDIAQIVRRQLDGAISETDLVFCPANSPLRQVTRYKTDAHQQEVIVQRRKKFGLS